MPKTLFAIAVFIASLIASSAPATARDYSSCLRAGLCDYRGYAPCRALAPVRNTGCYDRGYAYDNAPPFQYGVTGFGIPGSWTAGGGPIGASQSTNGWNASNEMGAD